MSHGNVVQPEQKTNKASPSEKTIGHWTPGFFIQSVALLVASGLILLGVFSIHSAVARTSPPIQSKIVSAGNWPQQIGVEQSGGGQLEMFAGGEESQTAVSSGPVEINADRYPFLEVQTGNRSPGVVLLFVWRTDADPQTVNHLVIPRIPAGSPVVALKTHRAWSGTINEFGLVVVGKSQHPVVIGRLEFHGADLSTSLAAVWTDWTAFEGWSMRSVNFVVGGRAPQFLPLLPAIAAWLALALALQGALVARTRTWNWRTSATMLLLVWGILDLRWQFDRVVQLGDTHRRYAGKSASEKFLAGEDAELYRFVQQVEKEIPRTFGRIFLFGEPESGHQSFEIARTRYFLLPRNTCFRHARLRAPELARSGDYFLALEGANDLVYNPLSRRLSWQGGSIAPVELVMSSPSRRVYVAK